MNKINWGHVAGYKLCATCGAKTTPQLADHSEYPHVREARLKREAEIKIAEKEHEGKAMTAVERSPQGPNMSLYGLERELLELLQYRDDVADEVQVTEEGRTEQQTSLAAIDQQIAEYVKRQAIARADSVIAALRECKGRADTLKVEAKRLGALAASQDDRYERIRTAAAEALAATVPSDEIVAAGQGSIIKRVKGKLGELKLCKSPPSVDVTDMSLLPDEHKTATVTLNAELWLDFCRVYAKAVRSSEAEMIESVTRVDIGPDKRAIAAVLKSQVPCEKCGGNGVTDITDGGATICYTCGGTGKQRGTVPGARLIEDSVHIRVS